jgi:hypothetical protein
LGELSLEPLAPHVRERRTRSLGALDDEPPSPAAPAPRMAYVAGLLAAQRLLASAGMLGNNASPKRSFEVTPPEGRLYDFYLIHCQETAQDQCSKLNSLLKEAGASVWWDMEATDLTAAGMERGVSQSRNVILFLSKGVMSRPFCHSEMRWAKQYKCGIVGVKESDGRHGAVNLPILGKGTGRYRPSGRG